VKISSDKQQFRPESNYNAAFSRLQLKRVKWCDKTNREWTWLFVVQLL